MQAEGAAEPHEHVRAPRTITSRSMPTKTFTKKTTTKKEMTSKRKAADKQKLLVSTEDLRKGRATDSTQYVKFPGVDVFLGPEMKSTGEVMGIDKDFGRAFAKSNEKGREGGGARLHYRARVREEQAVGRIHF